jgi:hypothetical protein
MAPQAKSIRGLQPAAEDRTLTEDLLARVCSRLDDLSAQWASLDIGESFTVVWLDRNSSKRN